MMNSDIYTLPDDFGIGSKESQIYFYSNNKSSVKNKVIFTKNMFCLLQHGLKEVLSANGKEVITKNDVLMLTSGSLLMSESVAENDQYEAILVFFSNNILAEFCMRHSIPLTKNGSRNNILKVLRDDFLNNFCYSLRLLRQEGNDSVDELKVQEILGYISSKYPDIFQRMVNQALADTTDIKLKQIVDSNTSGSLTLDEFAFLCNMSVSTFKRHFYAIYNMSPQKYFRQTKMERAKQLLSLRKRPSEIFNGLGYENLAAFSSEFKKYSGVSPRQFQDGIDLLAKQVELST